MSSYKAMVDSGSTLTHVPQPYFDWLMKELSMNLNIVNTSTTNVLGYTYTCTEYRSLPTPYFRLGGQWIPFQLGGQTTSVTGQCTFGFVKNESYMNKDGIISSSGSDPFWILGKNFMKDYYITHDLDNKLMKFAPRISSNTPIFFHVGEPSETAA
jgi:hypothetical protein